MTFKKGDATEVSLPLGERVLSAVVTARWGRGPPTRSEITHVGNGIHLCKLYFTSLLERQDEETRLSLNQKYETLQDIEEVRTKGRIYDQDLCF